MGHCKGLDSVNAYVRRKEPPDKKINLKLSVSYNK
jgi:hypothetical protein